MGSSRKWLKILSGKKKISSISIERVSASEKPKRWKWWKSFHFTSKKFTHAEKETGLCGTGKNLIDREERAAIVIQTTFRVFLARKALRALKGLVRLQAAITGHETRKQSSVSLHCIQAFVRVQARIRRQRAAKGQDALGLSPQDLPRLIVENYTGDSEIDWCNTLGTLAEIQAKEQQKQVATIKRERAIAYAFCNKWKANTKINPGSLFDNELDNSTWIWFWLDEWLNGQPKKPCIARGDSKKSIHMTKRTVGARKKNGARNTATGGIQRSTNCKSSPCSSFEHKRVVKHVGSPGRFRLARSLSGGKGRGAKGSSPKSAANSQSGKSTGQLRQQPGKDVRGKGYLHRSEL